MANYRDLKGNRNENGDLIPNFSDPDGVFDIDYPISDDYGEKLGKENLKDEEEEKEKPNLLDLINKVIKDQGKGHSRKEVNTLFKQFMAKLDDDEYEGDKKNFGLSKSDMATMDNLFTIVKGFMA